MQAGRAEVRAVIERATHRRSLAERGSPGAQTILFLDEIHRFNKAQQDALLPAVEEGLLTLIGATTENPAFEVNGALLSRMRVYALQALTAEEVGELLRRASEAEVDDEAIEFLAARSEGDARTALNALELAVARRPARRRARDARARRGRAAAPRGAVRQKGATATTTTSRPGSRPRAARTPTRRCTTWR